MPVPNLARLVASREQAPVRGPAAGRPPRAQALADWEEEDFLENCSAEYCTFHPGPRSTIALSYNCSGTLLASTHGDHTVKVTSARSGRLVRVLTGHRRTPWVVRFHPSVARLLASGSLDHEVRLWDATGGACLARCTFGKPIASLAFHAALPFLAVGCGHKVYVWEYGERRDDEGRPEGDDEGDRNARGPEGRGGRGGDLSSAANGASASALSRAANGASASALSRAANGASASALSRAANGASASALSRAANGASASALSRAANGASASVPSRAANGASSSAPSRAANATSSPSAPSRSLSADPAACVRSPSGLGAPSIVLKTRRSTRAVHFHPTLPILLTAEVQDAAPVADLAPAVAPKGGGWVHPGAARTERDLARAALRAREEADESAREREEHERRASGAHAAAGAGSTAPRAAGAGAGPTAPGAAGVGSIGSQVVDALARRSGPSAVDVFGAPADPTGAGAAAGPAASLAASSRDPRARRAPAFAAASSAAASRRDAASAALPLFERIFAGATLNDDAAAEGASDARAGAGAAAAAEASRPRATASEEAAGGPGEAGPASATPPAPAETATCAAPRDAGPAPAAAAREGAASPDSGVAATVGALAALGPPSPVSGEEGGGGGGSEARAAREGVAMNVDDAASSDGQAGGGAAASPTAPSAAASPAASSPAPPLAGPATSPAASSPAPAPAGSSPLRPPPPPLPTLSSRPASFTQQSPHAQLSPHRFFSQNRLQLQQALAQRSPARADGDGFSTPANRGIPPPQPFAPRRPAPEDRMDSLPSVPLADEGEAFSWEGVETEAAADDAAADAGAGDDAAGPAAEAAAGPSRRTLGAPAGALPLLPGAEIDLRRRPGRAAAFASPPLARLAQAELASDAPSAPLRRDGPGVVMPLFRHDGRAVASGLPAAARAHLDLADAASLARPLRSGRQSSRASSSASSGRASSPGSAAPSSHALPRPMLDVGREVPFPGSLLGARDGSSAAVRLALAIAGGEAGLLAAAAYVAGESRGVAVRGAARRLGEAAATPDDGPTRRGDGPAADPAAGQATRGDGAAAGPAAAAAAAAADPLAPPSDDSLPPPLRPLGMAVRVLPQLVSSLSAVAWNALGDESPPRVRLRAWRFDEACPTAPLDPAGSLLLEIPNAILCSEMGVHFSPRGTFLAAAVACRPRAAAGAETAREARACAAAGAAKRFPAAPWPAPEFGDPNVDARLPPRRSAAGSLVRPRGREPEEGPRLATLGLAAAAPAASGLTAALADGSADAPRRSAASATAAPARAGEDDGAPRRSALSATDPSGVTFPAFATANRREERPFPTLRLATGPFPPPYVGERPPPNHPAASLAGGAGGAQAQAQARREGPAAADASARTARPFAAAAAASAAGARAAPEGRAASASSSGRGFAQEELSSSDRPVVELRVFSLDGVDFGRVVRAKSIRAAHCLTSVRFSPTGEHLLMAYGKKHASLLRSLGVSEAGDVTPMHTILEIVALDSMRTACALPASDDEINAALFHPRPGGGIAYGTKEGRLRVLRPNPNRGVLSAARAWPGTHDNGAAAAADRAHAHAQARHGRPASRPRSPAEGPGAAPRAAPRVRSPPRDAAGQPQGRQAADAAAAHPQSHSALQAERHSPYGPAFVHPALGGDGGEPARASPRPLRWGGDIVNAMYAAGGSGRWSGSEEDGGADAPDAGAAAADARAASASSPEREPEPDSSAPPARPSAASRFSLWLRPPALVSPAAPPPARPTAEQEGVVAALDAGLAATARPPGAAGAGRPFRVQPSLPTLLDHMGLGDTLGRRAARAAGEDEEDEEDERPEEADARARDQSRGRPAGVPTAGQLRAAPDAGAWELSGDALAAAAAERRDLRDALRELGVPFSARVRAERALEAAGRFRWRGRRDEDDDEDDDEADGEGRAVDDDGGDDEDDEDDDDDDDEAGVGRAIALRLAEAEAVDPHVAELAVAVATAGADAARLVAQADADAARLFAQADRIVAQADADAARLVVQAAAHAEAARIAAEAAADATAARLAAEAAAGGDADAARLAAGAAVAAGAAQLAARAAAADLADLESSRPLPVPGVRSPPDPAVLRWEEALARRRDVVDPGPLRTPDANMAAMRRRLQRLAREGARGAERVPRFAAGGGRPGARDDDDDDDDDDGWTAAVDDAASGLDAPEDLAPFLATLLAAMRRGVDWEHAARPGAPGRGAAPTAAALAAARDRLGFADLDGAPGAERRGEAAGAPARSGVRGAATGAGAAPRRPAPAGAGDPPGRDRPVAPAAPLAPRFGAFAAADARSRGRGVDRRTLSERVAESFSEQAARAARHSAAPPRWRAELGGPAATPVRALIGRRQAVLAGFDVPSGSGAAPDAPGPSRRASARAEEPRAAFGVPWIFGGGARSAEDVAPAGEDEGFAQAALAAAGGAQGGARAVPAPLRAAGAVGFAASAALDDARAAYGPRGQRAPLRDRRAAAELSEAAVEDPEAFERWRAIRDADDAWYRTQADGGAAAAGAGDDPMRFVAEAAREPWRASARTRARAAAGAAPQTAAAADGARRVPDRAAAPAQAGAGGAGAPWSGAAGAAGANRPSAWPGRFLSGPSPQ